ncbi:hypothetical protein KI387_034341, partial [Taxus chinensis]
SGRHDIIMGKIYVGMMGVMDDIEEGVPQSQVQMVTTNLFIITLREGYHDVGIINRGGYGDVCLVLAWPYFPDLRHEGELSNATTLVVKPIVAARGHMG